MEQMFIMEVIFAIIVFKLVLNGWQPPIQESKQALLCIAIGVILSLIIEPTVHGFCTGAIASGIGFYGGKYVNEIKDLKEKDRE